MAESESGSSMHQQLPFDSMIGTRNAAADPFLKFPESPAGLTREIISSSLASQDQSILVLRSEWRTEPGGFTGLEARFFKGRGMPPAARLEVIRQAQGILFPPSGLLWLARFDRAGRARAKGAGPQGAGERVAEQGPAGAIRAPEHLVRRQRG